nr:hypothetical protein [Tanacetum cinerariifolium]
MSSWLAVISVCNPLSQTEECPSPNGRLFLTTGNYSNPGMDYPISVHTRSNVRLNALFLDTEEKSSVPPHNFPSMILQKIMWNPHTMTDVTTPTGQAPTMAPPVCSNDQILPRIRWVQTGYLKFSAKGSISLSNGQCLPRIRWVQTGYLKFSAKGTKREVFGMPILGSLITADLQEVSYYQEYLANVVKHRWFLSGEPARKPIPTAPKVQIHILQYLIHLRMCKDVPTKMMKMFLLVGNLRQQNPDNHEILVRISDKILEPNNTLEDRKELSQPG